MSGLEPRRFRGTGSLTGRRVGGISPSSPTSRWVLPVLAAIALVVASTPPRAQAAPVAVDVIAGTGLESSMETYSVVPTNYDTDAFQDVLVTYHDQGAKMYRNDGDGTYTRVAPSAWPNKNGDYWVDRHDCAPGDPNRDGRTDYYCAIGRTGNNIVKTDPNDNELWLQQPDGGFVDVGTAWGLGDPRGRGRTAAFFDANRDGFQDLYVTNELPRPTDQDGGVGGENKFFLNQGGTALVPAPSYGLDLFLGMGTCMTIFDWDADGWLDVFICTPGAVKVFRNVAGTHFVDVTAAACLNQGFADADLVDLDRDGDMDIVGIWTKSAAYRLNVGGCFQPAVTIGTFPDGGNRVAEGDADGDGDLDVYALTISTTGNPDDYVFVNGGGLSFTRLTVPSAGGRGDDVEAIQRQPGAIDFLVLNGRENTSGASQLIALRSMPPPPTTTVFSDTFETGTLSKWAIRTRATVQTSIVHAGSYAVRLTATGSPSFARANLPSAEPTVRIQLWVNVRARPPSGAVILARAQGVSTPLVRLLLNASGTLAYNNEVAKVWRSSSVVLPSAGWHLLELDVTVGTAGHVRVLLDGVVVTGLDRTENLGAAGVQKLQIGDQIAGRTYDVAIDDVTVLRG